MTVCQICAATAFAPLVVQGGHEWIRCRGCGFVRLHHMPSEDEARRLQGQELADGYIADYRDRVAKKLRRSLRRALRLKRRMSGSAVLDIGSNLGFFVEAAHRVGLAPIGVEINPALCAAARARFPLRTFLTGTLSDHDLGSASFDGVYCSEVIEHVPDCRGLITGIAEVLRPGGVLYLTTPHLREYTRGRDRAKWRDFGAPDHKLYFDDRTIARLLGACGFGDVRLQFSFWRGIKLFARRA